MKNLLIILLLALLWGCNSQKKSVRSTSADSVIRTESAATVENKLTENVQNDKSIDTSQNIQNDKKTDVKTTTTTTEYYPPDPSSGKEKGAVKSETTTTTERQDTDKGKLENTNKATDKGRSEVSQEQQSTASASSAASSTTQTEEKTKQKTTYPAWLKWTMGILFLSTILFLYLKRTKVKYVLSGLWEKVKI